MKHLIFLIFSICLCFFLDPTYAQEPDYANMGPWSCELSPDLPYDPTKPNILVIGDSISQGYTPVLQTEIKDYNVIHNPCNGAFTGYTLRHIDKWLSLRKWEAIIFNLGIWDLNTESISVHRYALNLNTIAEKIINSTKNPIFVTTSKHPHPSFDLNKQDKMRHEALFIMCRQEIPVFDLELKSEFLENYKTEDLVH